MLPDVRVWQKIVSRVIDRMRPLAALIKPIPRSPGSAQIVRQIKSFLPNKNPKIADRFSVKGKGALVLSFGWPMVWVFARGMIGGMVGPASQGD
jgi:hypothetical protein